MYLPRLFPLAHCKPISLSPIEYIELAPIVYCPSYYFFIFFYVFFLDADYDFSIFNSGLAFFFIIYQISSLSLLVVSMYVFFIVDAFPSIKLCIFIFSKSSLLPPLVFYSSNSIPVRIGKF